MYDATDTCVQLEGLNYCPTSQKAQNGKDSVIKKMIIQIMVA
jgi:hypothetical protein